MYDKILKKDLKRKKTMNIILLLFIVLASTFIAGGVSNLTSIATAIDQYIDLAELSDYEVYLATEQNAKQMEQFISEHDTITDSKFSKQLMISRQEVKLNEKEISYNNNISIVSLENATISFFDKNNHKIESIQNGEVYLSPFFLRTIHAEIGDKLTIHSGDFSMEFTIAGISKDIVCGSAMMGMARFLINQEDFQTLLDSGKMSCVYNYGMKISDMDQFKKDFNQSLIPTMFNLDHSMAKLMYVVDMLLAAVLMLVSICLIVISILVLKFTINFTIDEEFREIGVMKAIGIETKDIRMLYITKYFMISLAGGVIGFLCSIPFGKMMLQQTMENIVMQTRGNVMIELVCSIAVAGLIVLESWRATGKIKKMKPIEAIRNGATGERFRGKGLFSFRKFKVRPVVFMAVNDISSKWRQFLILFFTFVVGILLVIMPINTMNTLQSDELVTWFSMAKSDVYMSKQQLFNGGTTKNDTLKQLEEIKEILKQNHMDAGVYQEIVFRMSLSYGENACLSLAFQGLGDVSASDYTYIEGSAPQQKNEVAITHVIAKKLNAGIGDTIQIHNGQEEKEYLVTAIYQTMNNLGEGIRFHEDEPLVYETANGTFGIQVDFKDNVDKKERAKRIETIEKLFPAYKVQTGGAYLDEMMGGISSQLGSLKQMIILIVIVVNILVVVLLEKTLLTKEKGEVGLLKAIGFRNISLIGWQVLRIVFILMGAIITGTLLSTPFSKITVGYVFQMMGAANIEFTVQPLEVYVFYPVLIFAATVIASFVAALAVRKISASETSNIE